MVLNREQFTNNIIDYNVKLGYVDYKCPPNYMTITIIIGANETRFAWKINVTSTASIIDGISFGILEVHEMTVIINKH